MSTLRHVSCSRLWLRGQYQILLSKLTIHRDVNHPSPWRQMTSIIYPSLLSICTALLSPPFCCHPLCLPVFNHLPLYLHHSVYLSIISCSIPLSSFQPLCFILLFQPTCQFHIFLLTLDLCFPSCSPHPFRAIITSPDSLYFLCSALPLLPGALLPLCCPST